MKMIDKIRSMNTYEFADWLSEYIEVYSAPWSKYFDRKYCKRCYTEIINNTKFDEYMEYPWCELNGKCKYFPEMDDVPTYKQTIMMWLESEG